MGLSTAALVSLTALTLHLSLLSSVLFISRSSTSGPRYNPSSAVVLTEVIKIIVSIGLVFSSGELEDRVIERKRIRDGSNSNAIRLVNLPTASSRNEGVEKLPDWPSTPTTKPTDEARTTSSSPQLDPDRKDSNLTRSKRREPSAESLLVSIIPSTLPSPLLYDQTSLPPPDTDLVSQLKDIYYWYALIDVIRDGAWRVALPAVLFAFQNNIQYVASGNLSVPVSQLLYQLKIPATALFSIILLKRTLLLHQWLSLAVLTLGVCILLRASDTSSTASTIAVTAQSVVKSKVITAVQPGSENAPNPILGTVAVIASCLSSGFASTYFERLLRIDSNKTDTSAPDSPSRPHRFQPVPATSSPPLVPLPTTDDDEEPTVTAQIKVKPPSIWIRNIQLSMFGLVTTLPVVLYEMDRSLKLDTLSRTTLAAVRLDFFRGFNPITWVVIVLQVMGGLIGALVIHHADNIAKGFATSLSILLSIAFSVWLFDFDLSPGLLIGAVFVLGATALFSRPNAPWS